MRIPRPYHPAARLIGVFMLGAAVLLCQDATLAAEGPNLPPAEYKPLPVGTKVNYREVNFIVQRVDGFDTVLKAKTSPTYTRSKTRSRVIGYMHAYAVFGRQGSLAYSGLDEWTAELTDEARKALEAMWPLEVGKKAAFKVEEQSAGEKSGWRTWQIRIEVEETGVVTHREQRFPVYIVREKGNAPETIDNNALDYLAEYKYNPDSGLVLEYYRIWNSTERPGEYALRNREFASAEYGDGAGDLRLVALPPPKTTATINTAPLKTELARLRKEEEGKHEAQIASLKKAIEEGQKAKKASKAREAEVEKARAAEMARMKREIEKAREAEEARIARRSEEEKARQAEIARLQREAAKAQKARDAEMASLRKKLEAAREAREAEKAKDPEGIGDIEFGRYHALIIGIEDYKYLPKLETAANDALAVARVLKKEYGFKVTLLLDPDHGEVIDAFDEFREKLGPKDNLLIYYAGHGWLDEDSERGYWLPVNAKPKRRRHWVSNATITDALKALSAKHVMVVADSCYSGTLVRGVEIRPRNRTNDYWKRMAKKWARVAITSGGLEPVADKGGGDNSPFAKAFVDALRENKSLMDGTTLFSKMRRPVIIAADQTPQYSDVRKAGHDGGDFLFVRKK